MKDESKRCLILCLELRKLWSMTTTKIAKRCKRGHIMQGNLLLVTTWNEPPFGTFTGIPIGTSYINAALRNNGFNVTCLAFTGEMEPEKILRETMRKNNIEIVLCGGLTFQYKWLKTIFDIARDTDPSVITIGGGGGFTAGNVG